MHIREIQKKADITFRKSRKKLSMTVLTFIALSVSVKISELTAAFIMISEGYMSADEIFLPSCYPWLMIRSGAFILGNIVSVCAMTAIAKQICRILYPDAEKCTLKIAMLMMLIKCISFAAFFPIIYSVYLSKEFLMKAYSAEYSEGLLTVSFYLLVLSAIFAAFYIYVISGLLSAPFILIRNGGKNIFGSIKQSFSCMSGNRIRFFGLLISFIPYGIISLLIFPAPSAISKFISWLAVFADDALENRACEYDYNYRET